MNLDNQNSEKSKQLLLAQRKLYSNAKSWTWLTWLAALLPIAAQLIKPFIPNAPEYFNMFSVIVGGALALLISYRIKKKIELAARMQEEFDLGVYEIPRNEGLTGRPVTPDERLQVVDSDKIPDNLSNWYSPVIATAPHPSLAILLCQRENVVWDWHLKLRTARILAFSAAVILISAIACGLIRKMQLSEWLMNVFSLVAVFLYLIIQFAYSIYKVGVSQRMIEEEINANVEGYKTSKTVVGEQTLRLYQDRIFKNRTENCMAPDFLYWLSRKSVQNRTSASSDEIIKSFR